MNRTHTHTNKRHWCAFIFLWLIVTNAHAIGLSGSYTINPSKSPSSTNYTSFNDADSDLVYGARANGASANGPGVTAAVVFNVTAGLYVETLEIPYISGTSASNTITFQGVKGDSTKVVLQWPAGTGSWTAPNSVVHFNNTSFIILNELTLQMTMGTASYSYYDHVVIMDNVSDSNQINNCQLIGPYTGSGYNFQGALIYSGYNYTTYSYSMDQFNIFYNNYLKNGYYGIYWMGSYYSGGGEQGNIFDHNTMDSCGGYYGILMQYQDGVSILRNKINMSYGNVAMYIYELSGSSYYGNTGFNRIANNFINVGNSNNSYGNNSGMMLYYLDNTDIVYNNINQYGTSAYGGWSAYIYSFMTTSALNIYNNNFINTNNSSNDYALFGYNWTDENYNNLLCNGMNLVSYNGGMYSNLAAYKASVSPFAGKDTSVNPMFTSSTDLHVNNPVLNGTATSISYITMDIDSEWRSTTAPDIGADEFTPPALRPAITSILAPGSGFCAGTQDVYVQFSNLGLNTLTSATIEWSINGVAQTSFAWSGSLNSGANTSIKIGSYAFSSSSSVYKVLSYISNGNGTSFPFIQSSADSSYVRAGMTGTYTIDASKAASASNYTSFRSAVADLNAKGVCSAVTFNVADGYYNESIQINKLANVSATRNVVFQSANGDSSKVILDTANTSSKTSYTVNLNGSNYITFRKMTISNYGTPMVYGSPYVIYMSGGASYCTIENNQLLSSAGSMYNYGCIIFNDYASNENYNTIYNNLLSGASFSIQLQGGYNHPEFGNVVYHNIMDSASTYGYYSQNQDSLQIKNNIIYMPSSGYVGLYIYGNLMSGSTDSSYIANNFITCTGPYANGIMVYYCHGTNVYYNSINTSTSASYYFTGYFYNWSTGMVVNVVNNIFNNDGGGLALFAYNNGITYSDFNDIYSNGGTIANWNGSTSCSNLNDWQIASTFDANSVSGDPMFTSVATGDLHLTASSYAVQHFGTPIMILDDIDGEKRNLTAPNIGADETALQPLDAGIKSIDSPSVGLCSGTKDIYARIYNSGANTITSVELNWTAGGTTMSAVTWTGSITTKGMAHVKMGTITFSAGVSQKIVVWIKNVNGSISTVTANDTAKAIKGGARSGTFNIDPSSASAFPDFRSAVNAISTLGICGPVTFNVANGYYNESISIKNILGSNATNTITFQSKSGVASNVILDTTWATWSNRGYTVQLSGANYIKFNNLTITNFGSGGYADVVSLNAKASNNTITNCELYASTALYSNYGAVVYNDYNSVEQFNVLDNNIMSGAFYGVQFNGPYGNAEFGNVINACTIDSQSIYGLYLFYQDSMTVTGNTIYQPTAGYGIMSYYNVSNGSGNDTSIIANNFVTLSNTSYGYGIMGYYNDMLNIYYNSVDIAGNYGYSIYLYHYLSGKYINIYNNSFYNESGGYVHYIYNIANSDFNNYYTSGSMFGYWSGNNCYSLSDIQTYSGMDVNSVSGDPAYNNSSIGDLHATSLSTVLKGTGNPLYAVTKDIDKQSRGTKHSDIGADEFSTIAPDDLGITAILSPISKDCGNANTIVAVKVHNFGTNAQSKYDINVSVKSKTGTVNTSASVTTTINAGADYIAYVSFSPALNTSAGGSYFIKANTNLSGDGNTANDTDSVTVVLNTPPVAKFSVNKLGSLCTGDSLKVTDGSSITGAANYKYYLLDNTGKKLDSSTKANPIFIIATAGSYSVWQGISNGTNCYDSTRASITVYERPKASFTSLTKCPGDRAYFSSKASAGSGTIVSYAWDFGNKSTASSDTASTIYSAGAYTVLLTVTNSNGCNTTVSNGVSIFNANSSFSSKVDTASMTINFTSADTTLTNYSWDFGDGSVNGTTAKVSHMYAKANKYYHVILTASNGACSSSTYDSVIIHKTYVNNTEKQEFQASVYPNPFKENTHISYTLDNAVQVKIELVDILGRPVAEISNHLENAGMHEVKFNAHQYMKSGIYILKMTIGNKVISKQLSYIK